MAEAGKDKPKGPKFLGENPYHRRIGFWRGGGDPGGYQDGDGAGGVCGDGGDGADHSEHARGGGGDCDAGKAVRAQMEAVLKDIGADVIKTGMLGKKALVETLAEALEDLAAETAGGGSGHGRDIGRCAAAEGRGCGDGGADGARAALVTPNAPEAEVLTGKAVDGVNGQRRAAESCWRWERWRPW